MNVVSALTVLAALFVIYRMWSKWPLDIIGIFCLDFMLFYGFRAIAVGFGLDGVYPDYLFSGTPPVVQTNMVILVFLLCVAAGLFLGGATRARATWVFPSFKGQLSVRRGFVVAFGLTAVSTVMTLFLMSRFGGFGGLIRAGKLERDLAGLFFLRIIPGIGALVAAATFLELVRRRRRRFSPSARVQALATAGMALLNGFWVFAWGARSLLAIVVFMLLAGTVVFRTGAAPVRFRRRRLWLGLTAVLVVAAGAIVGLRFARDYASRGELNATIADQSPIRQVSVSSNATYYDAVVLSVRDWPRLHPHRGGEDFYTGMVGVVPRALWPDKPESIVPGAWFRRVYEPSVQNGWPMGSAGEWYLNFGVLGVVFGGVVSGICLSFASRSLARAPTSPMVFVTTVIIGLQVLEVGFNTQSVLRWVAWCLPILLVSPFLRLRRPRTTPAPGPAATADATATATTAAAATAAP